MKRTILICIAALVVAAGAIVAFERPGSLVPVIDSATQIEVLATNFEFAAAQSAALPYVEAMNKARDATQPPLEKANKQCNPDGGKKYEAKLRDRKVLCVAAPPSSANKK